MIWSREWVSGAAKCGLGSHRLLRSLSSFLLWFLPVFSDGFQKKASQVSPLSVSAGTLSARCKVCLLYFGRTESLSLFEYSAMGRPRAENRTREFAIAFASLVTTHSPYQYDWVARKGQNSIFALFCQLAPKVSSRKHKEYCNLCHNFDFISSI